MGRRTREAAISLTSVFQTFFAPVLVPAGRWGFAVDTSARSESDGPRRPLKHADAGRLGGGPLNPISLLGKDTSLERPILKLLLPILQWRPH
jgi:hypothetical protein